MADTLIKLRSDPGLLLVTQFEDERGYVRDSTSGLFVPLLVGDWPDYDHATPESPAGSGRYLIDVVPLSISSGILSWIHFEDSGSAVPGRRVRGYGEKFWTGSEFNATPPTSTAFDALAAFVTVQDPNPTDRSFVVALQGNAPVPEDGDYVGLFCCGTSGKNLTSKRQVVGYRRVTETLAEVIVGSPFCTAPESGDSFTIL